MFEEGTLEIVLVLKVFKMAKKYIYIYLATECYGGYCEHVIFALNSGGLSREKNVSTKSWRWSRIFPDKLLD